MRVAVGDHDVFFPVRKLRGPCRSQLHLEPFVVRLM
jgi:hypothetical protein